MSMTVRDLKVQASEIMTKAVINISEDAPVLDAVKVMVENNIECLVIVDDDRRVRGIMTVQDLLRKVMYQQVQPSGIKVADIMSSPVTTCGETTTLLEIVKIMKAKKIRRIPIVDDQNRLVGIITTFDLAVLGWEVSI